MLILSSIINHSTPQRFQFVYDKKWSDPDNHKQYFSKDIQWKRVKHKSYKNKYVYRQFCTQKIDCSVNWVGGDNTKSKHERTMRRYDGIYHSN